MPAIQILTDIFSMLRPYGDLHCNSYGKLKIQNFLRLYMHGFIYFLNTIGEIWNPNCIPNQ